MIHFSKIFLFINSILLLLKSFFLNKLDFSFITTIKIDNVKTVKNEKNDLLIYNSNKLFRIILIIKNMKFIIKLILFFVSINY